MKIIKHLIDILKNKIYINQITTQKIKNINKKGSYNN